MADVDMDFAGRHPADAAIHRAIASLVVGAELRLTGRELQTMAGIVVGRLSKNCSISEVDVISISVFAIALRHEEAVSDAGWRDRLKVKSWETILCVF
ncbi:MAG: hypothetical protein Q8K61_04845 [Gallionella sp.]|nr:hypothetical protein [Gallionella sp.]